MQTEKSINSFIHALNMLNTIGSDTINDFTILQI